MSPISLDIYRENSLIARFYGWLGNEIACLLKVPRLQ